MSTIVVADDEAKIGRMLQDLLEGDGHTVRLADTTEAAWALMVHEPPDLLITDMKLPPTNGLTLMQQLHAKHPTVPVIMITGFDDAETEAIAKAAGVKGFFGKPLNLAEVGDTVRQLLSR